MLIMTPKGLYCPAGNFHIDPKGVVEHAIVTHAHSDHARRGAKQYYCAKSGISLLKARVGQKIQVQPMEYGKTFNFNGVSVSLHPAGHILGSAQVRMEFAGEVWVASGDYKRDFDPTCEPFESVDCDVFVSEATFGTPAYVWEKNLDLGKQIYTWWRKNADIGLNSVLFAYSLGKAQRVLGVLEPHTDRPVYCHPAATELNECYRQEGIRLAPTKCLSEVSLQQKLEGELLLVPQSFLKSPLVAILGKNFETAFASGWMAKGHHGYNQGFVMSDHADWNDLVKTIVQSRAKRVYVQHRGSGALVKHLKKMGLQAFPESELLPSNPAQLSLF